MKNVKNLFRTKPAPDKAPKTATGVIFSKQPIEEFPFLNYQEWCVKATCPCCNHAEEKIELTLNFKMSYGMGPGQPRIQFSDFTYLMERLVIRECSSCKEAFSITIKTIEIPLSRGDEIVIESTPTSLFRLRGSHIWYVESCPLCGKAHQIYDSEHFLHEAPCRRHWGSPTYLYLCPPELKATTQADHESF